MVKTNDLGSSMRSWGASTITQLSCSHVESVSNEICVDPPKNGQLNHIICAFLIHGISFFHPSIYDISLKISIVTQLDCASIRFFFKSQYYVQNPRQGKDLLQFGMKNGKMGKKQTRSKRLQILPTKAVSSPLKSKHFLLRTYVLPDFCRLTKWWSSRKIMTIY